MKIKKLIISFMMLATALSGIAQDAAQRLRIGAKAPDFTLNDQNGNKVNLYQLLKKGSVILKWYRGGWCPLCNLELKGFADKVSEINQLGAHFGSDFPRNFRKAIIYTEKNQLSSLSYQKTTTKLDANTT